MAKFAFSLQRVLDYRRLEEDWAKDAFRLAREAREQAESALEEIRLRRRTAVLRPADSLISRLELESYLGMLDREEEVAQGTLAARVNEEGRAQDEWRERRQAAEALQKLRESAEMEWQREESRREQAELDEWAVLRR